MINKNQGILPRNDFKTTSASSGEVQHLRLMERSLSNPPIIPCSSSHSSFREIVVTAKVDKSEASTTEQAFLS